MKARITVVAVFLQNRASRQNLIVRLRPIVTMINFTKRFRVLVHVIMEREGRENRNFAAVILIG